MPFLKNILHDLIEKRLWPVAVALLVALVAVPVLLGGGDPAAAPAPGTPAGGAGTAGQAAVSLDSPAAGVKAYDRGGRVRNPFKQPKPKVAKIGAAPGSAAGTSSSGSSPASGPGDSSPGAGKSDGGGSPTPGTGATATPTKPDGLDTFRLTLRFGSNGNLRTIRDLARLSPLPSANSPFFVYLGVLKDGVTAVFLVSSDAKATGDGRCRPSASNCQTIEVKEGDTEFFDLGDAAHPIQYEMDVLHLDRTSDAQKQVTAAAARAAASRHSRAGAAMLRKAHADQKSEYDGMNGYRWLPGSGVLARVPASAKASSVSGARAGRKALPGLPVWHAELTA